MWIILSGALAVLSPAKHLAVMLLATLLGFFQDVLNWPAFVVLTVIALLVWLQVENPANHPA